MIQINQITLDTFTDGSIYVIAVENGKVRDIKKCDSQAEANKRIKEEAQKLLEKALNEHYISVYGEATTPQNLYKATSNKGQVL